MKIKTERWRRLCAALLCLCMTMTLAPEALADGAADWDSDAVIHIRSASDWSRLIRYCRLDTWSQGKTVRLECDLLLEGEMIVPTFGGVFDGGGHTIAGVRIAGSGSDRGLFRYIQAGGVVRDLVFQGTIRADDGWEGLGGICGVNRGTISGCTVHVSASGSSRLGGVCGVNEASGEIIGCTASGTVQGEHFTGGIVGENYGSVIQCVNKAEVNTVLENVRTDLGSIDWSAINSTENLPACTDTGGIAGYSKGVIQGCTNLAAVGYAHTGYNVGGIVGRQAGYVRECVNDGSVQGRKEVGGIAGQMEPYTRLQFEESTLQKLGSQLSTLQSLLGDAADDLQGSRKDLSGQMADMEDLADGARTDAEGLLDQLRGAGEEGIGTVNDLSARISGVLEQLTPVLDSLEETSDAASAALRTLAEAAGGLEDASGSTAGAMRELQAALKEMDLAVGDIQAAAEKVAAAQQTLRKALGMDAEIRGALEELAAALEELQAALRRAADAAGSLIRALAAAGELPGWDDETGRAELETIRKELEAASAAAGRLPTILKTLGREILAEPGEDLLAFREAWQLLADAVDDLRMSAEHIRGALQHLSQSAGSFSEAGSDLGGSADRLRKAMKQMASGADALTGALEGLRDIVQEQAEQPVLEFPGVSSEMQQREDSLRRNVDAMAQLLRSVQGTLDTAGDRLHGDLEKVSAQFSAIVDLLNSAGEDDQTSGEDRIVDVSEESGAVTLGTVAGCENHGAVDGDINTGGIAGAMALEFDFDPEDDLVRQGEVSLRFQYLTHAVLRGCVNDGSVTGRKNCVGGIVGRADLGLVSACQNYGGVESTDGTMAGGIAGESFVPVRGCWAKCALGGDSYVGGIAGKGGEITGCRTLVSIGVAEACVGAVAGQAEGPLSDNLFVSETLGGVDGISYAGQAQPVDYQDFLALGAPEPFTRFDLTFMAEGQVVDVVSFTYGQALPDERVPAVPEKEGCFAAWESFDRTALHFDRVVEAVYTPMTGTLAQDQILVEGAFAPSAVLQVTEPQNSSLPPLEGTEAGLWQLSVSDGSAFTALRVKKPAGTGRLRLWIRTPSGGWEALDHTVEGSWLRAEWTGSTAVLCLEQRPGFSLWTVCLAGGLAALLAAGGVCLARRRKKRTSAAPVQK